MIDMGENPEEGKQWMHFDSKKSEVDNELKECL